MMELPLGWLVEIGATPKQIEKFKYYLGVVFTSDVNQDKELDTQIGKANVVMRALRCSVVMKRELPNKAKLFIHSRL